MSLLTGAAVEYLRRFFGGEFEVEEKTETVGTTPIQVLSGDAERVSLTFVNLGATTIYIAPTPEVAALRGIRLGPTGGTLTANVFQDSLVPALQWYAIGSGAGGTLFTMYVRRSRIVPKEEEG